MGECYLCGVSEEKALLYEGIHKSHGIVKVCRKCYFKDRIPFIDKKELNLEKINTRESVRERLSKIARVKLEKKEEKRSSSNPEDVNLRELVEKNFKKEVTEGIKFPPDLIDNFNWIVMRKRRALKITKEKLALAVMVPAIAIESLEKGVLPKDYKPLIKKVEGYLRLNLFKESEMDHQNIISESKIPTGILIEDLKKKAEKDKESYIDVANLSLEKINEVYGVPAKLEVKLENREKPKEEKKEKKNGFVFKVRRFFSKKPEKNEWDGKKEELKNKKDLSDEEIKKLVWGK